MGERREEKDRREERERERERIRKQTVIETEKEIQGERGEWERVGMNQMMTVVEKLCSSTNFVFKPLARTYGISYPFP